MVTEAKSQKLPAVERSHLAVHMEVGSTRLEKSEIVWSDRSSECGKRSKKDHLGHDYEGDLS